MYAAAITGTIWLMMTVLLCFFLSQLTQSVIVSTILVLIFVILPIVNHIRIFFAIRRHNNQIQDAVSGQNLSAIFRREKKAAIDMFIVIAVLMLCLAPTLVSNVFKSFVGEHYELFYVWSRTLIFINPSMNPVIYLARNSAIRNAVRTMMHF